MTPTPPPLPPPPVAPAVPVQILHGVPHDATGGIVSGFPFFAFLPVVVVTIVVVLVIVLVVVAVARGDSDRRGRLLPLVYYYLATTVGLALVLVGLIGCFRGLVQVALPRTGGEVSYSEPPFDQQGNPVKESKADKAEREADAEKSARNQGEADAIDGAITALVGAPVFLWHLRQARRKEPELLGTTPDTAAG